MGGAGISQKRFCLIIYLQYLSLSFTISKNYVDDAIVLGENGGERTKPKKMANTSIEGVSGKNGQIKRM